MILIVYLCFTQQDVLRMHTGFWIHKVQGVTDCPVLESKRPLDGAVRRPLVRMDSRAWPADPFDDWK